MSRAKRIPWITCSVAMMSTLASTPVYAQERDDAPSRIVPFLVIGVLLCGALLVGYASFKANQPFGLARVTSLPANEITERLAARFSMSGWQVNQIGDGLAMYRRAQPSCGITVALFALGIIPGLLYLLLGGRDLTIFVSSRTRDDGTTHVEITGNAHTDGAYTMAKEILDGLP